MSKTRTHPGDYQRSFPTTDNWIRICCWCGHWVLVLPKGLACLNCGCDEWHWVRQSDSNRVLAQCTIFNVEAFAMTDCINIEGRESFLRFWDTVPDLGTPRERLQQLKDRLFYLKQAQQGET